MIQSVTADATTREQAELAGQMLERLAPEPAAVAIEHDNSRSGCWSVNGLFQTAPSPIDLLLIESASGCGPFRTAEIGDDDWVSLVREGHAPVIAGQFWVFGSHETGPAPPGLIPIQIDASVAFGTGHHGTTQGCLGAMSRLRTDGVHPGSVCDLGCGSGILAIAAAKLWQCHVLAIDNDPWAVSTAAENVRRNNAAGFVEVAGDDGSNCPRLKDGSRFDLFVANILAGPLIGLAPDIARATAAGGRVVLSGLLEEEGSDVTEAYSRTGLVRVCDTRIDGWLTLILARKE